VGGERLEEVNERPVDPVRILDEHDIIVEVVTPTTPELPPRLRLYLRGNNLEAGGRGCGLLGERTGRFNEVTEPRRTNRDMVPVERVAPS
jgi:hypothetical protein